jgi:ligand-binding SRPBCC domain-containing protein
MPFQLTCEMTVPKPVGEVFEFFAEPRNLALITPPELGFKITTNGKIEMRKGAEIDYRIRWLGLPMRWRTLITEFDPPRFFSDEQLRGPYRLWSHSHYFTEVDGTSTITDRVVYEMPMGIIGRVAHSLMVGRQLQGIFAYRQRAIAKILGVPDIRFGEPEIANLERV